MSTESRSSEQYKQEAELTASQSAEAKKLINGGAEFVNNGRLDVTGSQLETIQHETTTFETYIREFESPKFLNKFESLTQTGKELELTSKIYSSNFQARNNASRALLEFALTGEPMNQDHQHAINEWKKYSNHTSSPQEIQGKAKLHDFYSNVKTLIKEFGIISPSTRQIQEATADELYQFSTNEIIAIIKEAVDAKLYQAYDNLGKIKR